jgi:hypothetical protein
MPMRVVLAGAPVAELPRGEIYEVSFDPAKGREQKGRRYFPRAVDRFRAALGIPGLASAVVSYG